jgi:hypothetical protein
MRVSASATWSATTIVFGERLEADLRRRSVAGAFEYRVLDELTLVGGIGASFGGDIRFLGERHELLPGPVGTAGAAYRILAGTGWEPFVLFGGAFSVSSVGTRSDADDDESTFTAIDARFSLTVGETFLNSLVPYLTVRGFGGPANWSVDGVDLTGSDKFHFQVGGGLLATSGVVDAFIELIPLGERAAVFGGAISF